LPATLGTIWMTMKVMTWKEAALVALVAGAIALLAIGLSGTVHSI